MHLLRSAFRNFPAASRAAAIGLSVSLALLIGARVLFRDARPRTFLLGDSCIGNYRLEPGHRMQDYLEAMDPGLHVENLAEPGATPLDFFLQWSRGSLLSGRPNSVIIALEPRKFLNESSPHRLDEDGINLRWLPWNRSGLELFHMLSPRERNVALVQQASLPFYALADAGRSAWIRFVQWPWERAHMRVACEARRKKIEAKATELGRLQEVSQVPDERAFAELPRAKDAAFLLRSLNAAGIETRVILLPFGNHGLIQRTCSSYALAKQDTIIARMRHWLDARGVAYLDFNAPSEQAHFPEPAWDDVAHLKDPAVFAYMARRVDESLGRNPSRPGRNQDAFARTGTEDGEYGNDK